MGKIDVEYSKTLKLINVVSKKIHGKDISNIGKSIVQMDNYIKSQGGNPIGPYIQYVCPKIKPSGEIDAEIIVYKQSDRIVKVIDNQFMIEEEIKIENCIYARYSGSEDKLEMAYQKLLITAFEEDIKIQEGNYTVFVKKEADEILADVFIQKIE